MRLLFDENLSESVASRVQSDFPGSEHVRRAIGTGVSDGSIWEYAQRNGFVLVTLDEDFQRMSMARGAPPKVIWIESHNARNAALASMLIAKVEVINRFISDSEAAMLVLIAP